MTFDDAVKISDILLLNVSNCLIISVGKCFEYLCLIIAIQTELCDYFMVKKLKKSII